MKIENTLIGCLRKDFSQSVYSIDVIECKLSELSSDCSRTVEEVSIQMDLLK